MKLFTPWPLKSCLQIRDPEVVETPKTEVKVKQQTEQKDF